MTKNTFKPSKRRPKACTCGCGEKFVPIRSNQVFLNAEHKKNYWAKRFNTFNQKEFQLFLANRDFFAQVVVHRVAIEQFLKRRNKRDETKSRKLETCA